MRCVFPSLSLLRRFAISLCYNAGTLELGRLGLNIYTTFSIAVAFEFPVYIVCILAVDTLGRRWPNVFFMFTGGVVCLAMSLLRTGGLSNRTHRSGT